MYMPIVYAINKFGLCFATMASLFVWLLLEKHREVMNAARQSWSSLTERRSTTDASNYPATPTWWYVFPGLVALALAIFACEFYPVQLRWYGAIFALFISFVFFVPVSFLERD